MVGKIVGKLSEIKLVKPMTSLLVSSRNAGNLKLFWFLVRSEFPRKTTQNPKLTSSPGIVNLKENDL